MKTLLQTLFFFLLVAQISFAQWYQQNSPTAQNLNAVTFIDVNNGFAVGVNGIIVYTTDGGVNWTIIPSGTSLSLNDIYFINSSDGWIVGGNQSVIDSAIVLQTTNGGLTWNFQSFWSRSCLKSVCFIDSITEWAVGLDSTYFSGMVIKTTNGGANWDRQFIESFGFHDVYFKDANYGMMAGIIGGMGAGGDIFKTTNGGSTWTSNGFGYAYTGITNVGTNIWCVVGVSGCVMRCWGNISLSTDDGTTWNDAIFPSTWGGFDDVTFVNNNIGWVVGLEIDTLENEFGAILYTEDGGINWTSQESGTTNRLLGVHFTDLNNGWAVGNNGTILHTTNGGVSFVEEEQIDEVPSEFLLSQNYPNPFNPNTKIKYSVPQSSQVTIKVFDILGNEIETLVNEEKASGTYEVTWYAQNLPSGVYFYQLKAGSFVETRKMLLLK